MTTITPLPQTANHNTGRIDRSTLLTSAAAMVFGVAAMMPFVHGVEALSPTCPVVTGDGAMPCASGYSVAADGPFDLKFGSPLFAAPRLVAIVVALALAVVAARRFLAGRRLPPGAAALGSVVLVGEAAHGWYTAVSVAHGDLVGGLVGGPFASGPTLALLVATLAAVVATAATVRAGLRPAAQR